MQQNLTGVGFKNIKGLTGDVIRRIPEGIPILHGENNTKLNIPEFSLSAHGDIAFNNAELASLLLNTGTKLAVTVHLYKRAAKNEDEMYDRTSRHLTKTILFPTITDSCFWLDTLGVSIRITRTNASSVTISTKALHYYKITIKEIRTISNNASLTPVKNIGYQYVQTNIDNWKMVFDADYDYDNPMYCSEAIAYADGLWLVEETSYKFGYSYDLITWHIGSISFLKGFTYGNGLWTAYTDDSNDEGIRGLYYSTDGINWTRSNLTGYIYTDAVYLNGMWFVGATDPDVTNSWSARYSKDGKTWSKCSFHNLSTYSEPPTTWGPGKIYYADGLWVAAGDYKHMFYSTDGINWYEGTIPSGGSGNVNSFVRQVHYANGVWVAVRYYAGLLYSLDGKNWSASNIWGSYYYPVCIHHSDGLWVAGGGTYGVCYYSTDGKNWIDNDLDSQGITSLRGLYHANGVWFARGNTGGSNETSGCYSFYSLDGKNWTKCTSKKFINNAKILFEQGKWITAGFSECAYVEADPKIYGDFVW